VLLKITGLSKRFGGLVALAGIDFAVAEGEVRGVIGPNGSGKSTLFNLVTGVYPADPGSVIRFHGEDITGREPHEIARRGIARTFQMLRMFAEMSVVENLLVGCHRQVEYGVGAALLGSTHRAACVTRCSNCSRLSGWPITPRCRRANCRSASGGCWRWVARWR
jgi:branched-chain amino acid transport system ATP-binding protein